MKQIIKSDIEPQALVDYREASTIDGVLVNYTWNSFQNPWKNQYKEYLLQEQGFICAYCMQTITASDMKIEHLRPRHSCITEAEKLDHSNMVAVCKGINDTDHHCDTRRGEVRPIISQLLNVLPTQMNPNCEEVTIFDGEDLKSIPNNILIETDINKKLNLNCNYLKTARNVTEQGFIEGMIEKAINSGITWTIELLQEQLNMILQIGVPVDHRRFNRFCLVEANVINQKIANLG